MSFSSDNTSLQNQIPVSIDLPRNADDMRTEINDLYQSIASSLNNKVGGLYVPQEKSNSELYFTAGNPQRFRNVYRMTVDFGALPNSTSKSVAHNIPDITDQFRLTSAWGGATDPVSIIWIPLPNEGIFVQINSTDVTITTTSNRTNFTACTVVIEYTKVA